ncbi:MAG: FAD-dependent oxidoreductase [Zoogloeaceae bacterium]|nr:FAD-dependent oxidoreductase [Zoogloeaceae bacterium]
MEANLVIVGSGLAGYSLLREFRRFDSVTPVTVLTADDGAAYSKGDLVVGLARDRRPGDLVIATAEQLAFRYQARIQPFTRVVRIDRATRTVEAPGGAVPWQRLVLATGAQAVVPRLRGTGMNRVLSVASLSDYAYLKAELAGRRRIALLGGSRWGCELADALVRNGYEVHLFESQARLFSGALPGLCSTRLARTLERSGIRLYLDSGVQRVDREVGGLKLFPYSGDPILVDLVLATQGTEPRVDLAREAGLAVGRGIQVDGRLATSDPDIFAVGECAEVQGRVVSLMADIEASSQHLAAILAGRPARLPNHPRIDALALPDCPLVLCAPPSVPGEWQERADREGVRATFTDDRGRLRGFALLGAAVADRDRLLAEVETKR